LSALFIDTVNCRYILSVTYEREWSNGGIIIMPEENRPNRRKSLFPCHFVNQKSQMDWPRIETGPPRWQGGN